MVWPSVVSGSSTRCPDTASACYGLCSTSSDWRSVRLIIIKRNCATEVIQNDFFVSDEEGLLAVMASVVFLRSCLIIMISLQISWFGIRLGLVHGVNLKTKKKLVIALNIISSDINPLSKSSAGQPTMWLL